MSITGLGAERAGGRGSRSEEGEAELATKEEAVCIRREAMVSKTAREGMHGDTCGGGKQGGENVEGCRVKLLAVVKEG
jgi:hypothetical protein